MKSNPLLLIVSMVFLSGCHAAQPNETPRAFVTEIAYSLTQSGIETETHISQADDATGTPPADDISGSNDTVIFLDDFVETLEAGWDWRNEEAMDWSLDEFPGYLLIRAKPGYINLGNAKNLLLRNAPRYNFTAETRVNFLPEESDQIAGIVLMESEKDFIQAGLGYCSPQMGCIREGFYIDIYKNGKLTLPRNFLEYSERSISIRMTVRDGIVEISISPDGMVWYLTMDKPLEFKPARIGLFAGQNNETISPPAIFDYFKLSAP